jgi:hypothetical protein
MKHNINTREEILLDEETLKGRFHPHLQKLVTLPDMWFNIASLSILIPSHTGVEPTPFMAKKLPSFICQPVKDPHIILRSTRDTTQFLENTPMDSTIQSEVVGNSVYFKGLTSKSKFIFGKNTLGEVSYFNSLENVLGAMRLATAHHLVHNKMGVLLHASSAIKDNSVVVFPGISDTGKTTAVKTTPGQVLADEITAILISKDSKPTISCWGTPFGARLLPSNSHGSDLTVAFIKKDFRNYSEKATTSDALSGLLQSTVMIPYNTQLTENIMDILIEIIKNSKNINLHATIDGLFWKEVFKW